MDSAECFIFPSVYDNNTLNTKFSVQSVDDEVEENNIIAPVIYEDDDESDDDASDDYSMEVDTIEDGEEPILYSDISDAEEDGEISD